MTKTLLLLGLLTLFMQQTSAILCKDDNNCSITGCGNNCMMAKGCTCKTATDCSPYCTNLPYCVQGSCRSVQTTVVEENENKHHHHHHHHEPTNIKTNPQGANLANT